ncbi:MAG: histidine phosphatase family protein [Pseudomonadota bacterium]
MEQLYVVRHGQTRWNAEQRLQGRLDSPLTPTGQQQAVDNGLLLADCGVRTLFVSPLGRTTETAYLMNSAVQARLEFRDALMECDCGEWGGRLISDLAREEPAAWQARSKDLWGYRPPGGESVADILARVAPLLDEIRALPETAVGVVSHGMVAKAILAHYLGLAGDAAVEVTQPNDVVFRLSFSGADATVEHFRGGAGPLPGLTWHKRDTGTGD